MRKFTQLSLSLVVFLFCAINSLQAQYAVSGAKNTDANGIYYESGTNNGKTSYSNGNYQLYNYDCTMRWLIGSSVGSCPEYSTLTDGDVPSGEGWHMGGKNFGSPLDPIMFAKLNSIDYDKDAFIESVADDGTFNDTINILLFSFENTFTGSNDEDFVATGKVVVSNIPEGLTAMVKRTSDSAVVAVLTGTAINHLTHNNIDNLSIEFQNSAFSEHDASEIENSARENVQVMFMGKYVVYGASYNSEVNDTFLLTGLFNQKPTYSNGEYNFHYRGCEWGAQWVLAENEGACPEYSTAIKSKEFPILGWYDGGNGTGSLDTICMYQLNGIVFSTNSFTEAETDDGSIDDSLIIDYGPINDNIFSGLNGDDFITDGKINILNLPDGLTAVAERVSDTRIILKFTGNAFPNNYWASTDNLSLEFLNSAFVNGNANTINNYIKEDFAINFRLNYEVSGAITDPDINGTYSLIETTYNEKPVFKKGEYILGFRDCGAKWVIVDGDDISNLMDENCPLASSPIVGDLPPLTGWHQGGYEPSDEKIYVYQHNSIVYSNFSLSESEINDGSIEDSIDLMYYFPSADNMFSGVNDDDFVSDGKLVISNLPEGLTASAIRTSDTTLKVKFLGKAINHHYRNNVNNLTFELLDNAFIYGGAQYIEYSKVSDLNITFIQKYEVMNATVNTAVNGTYISAGTFNGKLFFKFDVYRLGYRGCNAYGTKWVIVDGDDDMNIAAGYCPIISTEVEGDIPSISGWNDNNVIVSPHNSLYYSKTIFNEVEVGDGSIDNTDTLVIRYFFPENGAIFSGINGDNFVADGKVSISNIPGGLTAVMTRTSDTTLAVVLTGSASSDDVNDLTFAFTDNAFIGIDASNVIFSTKDDLEINFHKEYYVASIGGDYATITEAVNDSEVGDGDILILAAETFTEKGIQVEKALTFRGQGAGKTIVQADNSPNTAGDRIFNVYFDNFAKNVTFENMTMQNGNANAYGGALHGYRSNITIKNCEIKNNRINYIKGGAIGCFEGNFIAENCTFENNSIVDLSASNTTHGGGAIFIETSSDSDSAIISNCTFSGNSAYNQYGGALWASHNLKIINSTFANNGAYYGGGIYRNSRTIDMVNVLVADNSATTSGNDIYGSLNADYCLIEDVTGATITGANNVTGSDPELSALADNGGSTQTCAISSTSLAKDAGTDIRVPLLDQRGVSIYNSVKDIGAYEFNIDPVIMVSNTELEFGNVPVNESKELNYNLSAINLTNDVVITAPAEFKISGYSGSEFVGLISMTLVPDGGILDTTIYVQFNTSTNGLYEDIITHESTDAETVNISVKAKAVNKPTGDNGLVVKLENIEKYFASSDFIFADLDGDEFAGIQIITKETNGDLEYDGVNVVDGTVCENMSKLVFKSFEDESGLAYATFTFKVKDNTGLYSESDYTMTIDVNDIPAGANDAVSTDEDVEFQFAVEDFTFTNTVGDFDGIQIVSVETAGELKYNETDVTADIDCPDVTKLVFSAAENANGDAYATFEFKVKDNLGEYSEESYTMTINVTAVNDAPEGADDAVSTDEDLDLTFAKTDFTYSDVEGDAFAGISIVSVETAGELKYDGTDVTANTDYANVTLLVFKPLANENGDAYATFTFKVIDNVGAYSAESYTMTINVIEVNDAPTVANEIPDDDAIEGIAYTYTVPENTFADVDAGDVLTYTASLTDSNLPAWLSFDGTTRVFSGIPDASGSIILKVTVSDIASASVSDEFTLTIAPATTGIEDMFGGNLNIYPNPTSGKITISLKNMNSETKLVITDITGKVITNKTLWDEKTDMDLSNYAKGIYFIQFTCDENVISKRIIIE